MKIEKISETKLKITFSEKDMIEWNINCDSFLTEKDNNFLKKIIIKVTEETGVEFDNCSLDIELIKRKNGTLIMIITKEEMPRLDKTTESKKVVSKKSVACFYFKSLNDVISFAKNNPFYCYLFEGKNSLYREGEKIVLAIVITEQLMDVFLSVCEQLCEYADVILKNWLFYTHLFEHANFIIKESALRTLYCNL